MSDETAVKVRALMNVGQLKLNYNQVGEFPLEQVQPFLDRGRVELVEDDKPKRRSRSKDQPTPEGDELAVPVTGDGDEPE